MRSRIKSTSFRVSPRLRLISCRGIKFSKCESVLLLSEMLYCLFLELEELTTEHVLVFQQHHLYLQTRKLLLLSYIL